MTFDAANKSKIFTTQCFPLYSVLLAVNRTKLDWFRLSARGFELRILKTVPWNKVNVTVKKNILFHFITSIILLTAEN